MSDYVPQGTLIKGILTNSSRSNDSYKGLNNDLLLQVLMGVSAFYTRQSREITITNTRPETRGRFTITRVVEQIPLPKISPPTYEDVEISLLLRILLGLYDFHCRQKDISGKIESWTPAPSQLTVDSASIKQISIPKIPPPTYEDVEISMLLRILLRLSDFHCRQKYISGKIESWTPAPSWSTADCASLKEISLPGTPPPAYKSVEISLLLQQILLGLYDFHCRQKDNSGKIESWTPAPYGSTEDSASKKERIAETSNSSMSNNSLRDVKQISFKISKKSPVPCKEDLINGGLGRMSREPKKISFGNNKSPLLCKDDLINGDLRIRREPKKISFGNNNKSPDLCKDDLINGGLGIRREPKKISFGNNIKSPVPCKDDLINGGLSIRREPKKISFGNNIKSPVFCKDDLINGGLGMRKEPKKILFGDRINSPIPSNGGSGRRGVRKISFGAMPDNDNSPVSSSTDEDGSSRYNTKGVKGPSLPGDTPSSSTEQDGPTCSTCHRFLDDAGYCTPCHDIMYNKIKLQKERPPFHNKMSTLLSIGPTFDPQVYKTLLNDNVRANNDIAAAFRSVDEDNSAGENLPTIPSEMSPPNDVLSPSPSVLSGSLTSLSSFNSTDLMANQQIPNARSYECLTSDSDESYYEPAETPNQCIPYSMRRWLFKKLRRFACIFCCSSRN